MLTWVKLERYRELSGDTPDVVDAKRRTAKWLESVPGRIPADGRIWIKLAEMQKWIETSEPQSPGAASRYAAESHVDQRGPGRH